MKTSTCIVLIMVTISVAKDGDVSDVSVFNSRDYYYVPPTKRKPVFQSVFPWKFEFTSSDQLYTSIRYFNKSPSVTSVNLTHESDFETAKPCKVTKSDVKNVDVLVCQLRGLKFIVLKLNLYTSHGLCTSIRVAEGRVVSRIRPEKTKKKYKNTDICLKEITSHCVLLVDIEDFICEGPSNVTQKNEDLKTTTPLTSLENNTTSVSNVSSSLHENKKPSTNNSASNTETNGQQPPPHYNKLIYVIPSVMGLCVVILVIYVTVKKFCLRNSHPVETMELNTYATVNEVVYADLNVMHGDSQPPRRDEESLYAEIIGVLHPH